MSKFLNLALAASLLATPAMADKLGLGRAALPEEIAAWDKDVRPDGKGLPVGSGDALVGEEIFADQCASCHGDFAEGVDNWPKLAGGMNTLNREDPLKTVGSYWPHVSTVWDYVNRSMPFGAAQTLAPDDVYAIVAYILYSNDLIEDDFVLSNENLADFELPNVGGFFVDDRETTEYPQFSAPACMENCKDSVEITMHATVLDVTPDDLTDDDPVEEAEAPEPVVEAAVDPALIEAGERVFKKCAACHQVGEGAKHRTGPTLNGMIDRTAGTVDGFKYSPSMIEAGAGDMIWDDATLHAYLEKPRDVVPKTKMSFAGLKKAEDRDAVIAYLATFGE
ncbi:c-type cytochrome [Pseudorhodobacter turbinis]|uniref:C-type cytochrome n=1 Tax=Pseudorhodobacter turbinis TaxID=2500533 RepID=A0A4P8EG16_9RHOB|nr:c-type cytochrome [Pseudorhodobacter turbinis]QCO55652.1 c-type cytochrome [Pseudorhodobacter turbinis]